jgi:hypothetical protein
MLLKYILDNLSVSAPEGSKALTNYTFGVFILSLASPCITSFYSLSFGNGLY